MNALKIISAVVISTMIAVIYFSLMPLHYTPGAIYAMTHKVSYSDSSVTLNKKIGFSYNEVMMTATWSSHHTRQSYTITGDISSQLGPYMEILVKSFKASEGLNYLVNIPGGHMEFGRQHLFTPGSKIHIKFLKNDHQGICFYYYEGRSVLCYYQDY